MVTKSSSDKEHGQGSPSVHSVRTPSPPVPQASTTASPALSANAADQKADECPPDIYKKGRQPIRGLPLNWGEIQPRTIPITP